jgi:peptidase E
MELHLFSTPGPGLDVRWVLDACREVLGQKPEAEAAYLPLASLIMEKWLAQSERSFKNLARLAPVNPDTMEMSEMEGVLRQAALAYIPGGNAFLLSHRLHVSGLFPYLRQKIRSGLPVVAFSAGAVVCGPNILTSNDLNMVPTTHFEGFNVIPFNLNVHYTDSAERDEWLAEYRAFHDDPILMLEDGAYIKVQGKKTMLVRGNAWCWRAGRDKERLTAGEPIRANGGG